MKEEITRQIEEIGKRMDAIDESIEEMRKRVDSAAEKMSKSYIWSERVESERIEELEVKCDEKRLCNNPELFFSNVFYKSKTFNGIKYHEMLLNLESYKDWETSFDIVLIKEDSVAIIEVENNVAQPDFVQEFAVEKMKKFRKLFPELKTLKAYLGIAAFYFSKDVLKKARECGIGIIRKEGNSMKMRTEKLKAY